MTADEVMARLVEIDRPTADVVVYVDAIRTEDFCTPIHSVVVGQAPDGRDWIEIHVGWAESRRARD